MTNLTKDELIKLAELAGYIKTQDNNDFFESWSNGENIFIGPWQPDKDIKQAMECLESIKSDKIDVHIESCVEGWCCTIEDHRDFIDIKIYMFECREVEQAICKAILKALEGESDG